jgi:predicted ATPase
MLRRELRLTWDSLRAKKAHLEDFLEEIRIQNFRGIADLRIRFTYPVSVIAGENACGKTTILFALACAYKVPGTGPKDFVPSSMFPDFKSKDETIPSDKKSTASFEYYYTYKGTHYRMRWARGKGWNRSFLGLQKGEQPERAIYLRTLANLSNPSEVRSVLQLGHSSRSVSKSEITADNLTIAHRILPLEYRSLYSISDGFKDLLFATRMDLEDCSYSEFHMSAGERAILRISKDISQLKNAFILIDELEAGMHPFTQQLIMLELQRLALRNDLQIVITTHSPAVLDCVPIEGRIFLERKNNSINVTPPYRDLIQKALYGRSLDKISILCEDKCSESIIRGVLESINPQIDLSPNDIQIACNVGQDEFAQYIRALGKFKRLEEFIFILDGDSHTKEPQIRQASFDVNQVIRLLFLPENEIPENWVWNKLRGNNEYHQFFGVLTDRFNQEIDHIESVFSGSTNTPREIAKQRLFSLCTSFQKDLYDICRFVSRQECEKPHSPMFIFAEDLKQSIINWRDMVKE